MMFFGRRGAVVDSHLNGIGFWSEDGGIQVKGHWAAALLTPSLLFCAVSENEVEVFELHERSYEFGVPFFLGEVGLVKLHDRLVEMCSWGVPWGEESRDICAFPFFFGLWWIIWQKELILVWKGVRSVNLGCFGEVASFLMNVSTFNACFITRALLPWFKLGTWPSINLLLIGVEWRHPAEIHRAAVGWRGVFTSDDFQEV